MQRVRKIIGINDEMLYPDGSGIQIGVLDTGVSRHPDLSGRIIEFKDFIGNRSLSYDDNGHGTHVCGILCGSGRLSDGIYRGVAPGSRLVVGKVLDENGDGSTEVMLQGLDWILNIHQEYRIRILNISVGIGDLEEPKKTKALKNKIEELWDCGILVVCAAGNKGPGEGTLSAISNSNKVLTVGCFDGALYPNKKMKCELYSGRGYAGTNLRKPDLIAPGTEIISCNANCYKTRSGYKNAYLAKSGTSMSTPIVAGAAALLMNLNPSGINEEYREQLLFAAKDMKLPWNQQGWGMVNLRGLINDDKSS